MFGRWVMGRKFCFGKTIGWAGGVEKFFFEVVFTKCLKSFFGGRASGLEQQLLGMKFWLEKESF